MHHEDEGDMLFNNKNNSLGTSSIMSNKLVNMLTPINQDVKMND